MDENRLLHLIKCIEDIRKYTTIFSFDEAETKQKITSRILDALGWNMFSEEVKPEYAVGSQRVDFSLRIKSENLVFIEVKKPAESLENPKHQEQLLEYSFKQGVASAILSNGVTWWFYLPLQPGMWENRRYCTIDIMKDEIEDIVRLFTELLSKDTVGSGNANKSAESMFERHKKTKQIMMSLPEAWNKIVTDRNTLLIDLLEETAAKICEFEPDSVEIELISEEVRQFILDHQSIWLLPTEVKGGDSLSLKKKKGVIKKKKATNVSDDSVHSKPNQLKLGNLHHKFTYYYEVLVLVANWLVDQGNLTLSDCPINLSKGKKRYLVSSTPVHPTGKEFFSPVKLSNGLYLETHASTQRNIHLAHSLLKKYRYPEGTLEV